LSGNAQLIQRQILICTALERAYGGVTRCTNSMLTAMPIGGMCTVFTGMTLIVDPLTTLIETGWESRGGFFIFANIFDLDERTGPIVL